MIGTSDKMIGKVIGKSAYGIARQAWQAEKKNNYLSVRKGQHYIMFIIKINIQYTIQ